MNVLIIDNYDSFTYNLYQFIGEILEEERAKGQITEFTITVKRNDEITLAQAQALAPDKIIISPGPGNPEDENYFGVCSDIILEMGKTTSLLGVCLGMQGIVHLFGGKIVNADLPMHGKVSPITHTREGIFKNIPDQLEIMRYHSLVAQNADFPDCLALTAVVGDFKLEDFSNYDAIRSDKNFEIMGVKHKTYPIQGIQFHPESFATEGGKDLIHNFLEL